MKTTIRTEESCFDGDTADLYIKFGLKWAGEVF